ncbi:uncharacterized protein LOC106065944 [Biomphalaria glabrata]|uniref:Uncharacterized protein LOC106065944 n=1 Tax=Biomphalaria glabrata TaxID=6526 RepID=A0A9W2YVX2_BIOGL|nr:uncharacterized protein LOC106065944 [Biomphalaria glabrata]XP_055866830.1 uncharacterized protein LOC106065944 [Biomphalaria glabrata]XP_055866832.1 uncharacterized protein LOC106065944 [Biomphalaria glabrata]
MWSTNFKKMDINLRLGKALGLLSVLMVHIDFSTSQEVKWTSNNFKHCNQEKFIMKATFSRTNDSSFIVKSAEFAVYLSNQKIDGCLVLDLDTKCEPSDSKCYCETKSKDELVIVFAVPANKSYIGAKARITYPCANLVLSKKSEDLNISTESEPVLKISNQEIDLSHQTWHEKVPVDIEFCCDKNPSTPCTAYMMKNEKKEDNHSRCVSFTETSTKYLQYKMYSTHCEKNSKRADLIFFSQLDDEDSKRAESEGANEGVEVWVVFVICTVEIVGAIVINIIIASKYCPDKLKKFSVYYHDIEDLKNKVNSLIADMDTLNTLKVDVAKIKRKPEEEEKRIYLESLRDDEPLITRRGTLMLQNQNEPMVTRCGH